MRLRSRSLPLGKEVHRRQEQQRFVGGPVLGLVLTVPIPVGPEVGKSAEVVVERGWPSAPSRHFSPLRPEDPAGGEAPPVLGMNPGFR